MRERQVENTGKTFLSGVFLLTLSTLLVKIIGLIYKIPMLAYLGSEGMGYFNSAYEIYALLCVISTAGLPVALSVLISGALARGEREGVMRIYRTAMRIFLLIGSIGSGLMYLFAKPFCEMIHSEGAFLCIRAIAPTVFLICVSSALRGFFQGYSRMLPTAISQVLESLGKLVFGLLFAHLALRRGGDTPTVAAAAGWGLTLGTLLSLLYLCLEKHRFSRREKGMKEADAKKNCGISHRSESRGILWTLVRLALPMTLSAALISLTRLVDMTMILSRLQSIGMSEVAANEAYGSYTTLALSVFGLLPSLITSVSLPLIPMLSSAIASGKREHQEQLIGVSYRLTALFSIPSALGVTAFAHPILSLLFGYDRAAVESAAPLLSALGISVFLSCMITATNAILHAYRIVNRPILSMLAGTFVKVAFAYALIGNERFGLLGAPISTFACSLTVVLCNLYFADRMCSVRGMLGIFLRPLLAGGAAVGIGYGVYLTLVSHLGAHTLPTVLAISLTVLLYLVFVFLFGVLRREELLAMPMGERLCRRLERMHLLPKEDIILRDESKKRMKS